MMLASCFMFYLKIITLQLFQLRHLGLCGNWNVVYTPSGEACVLKGAEVVIHGTYKYPSYVKLIQKVWIRNPVKNVEPTDLKKVPECSRRITYTEESRQVFTLKLNNVTKQDEHMYCLRITTDTLRERYLGYPGVTLTVTELRVETPEFVTEGNTTLLTCRADCTLPNTTAFVWYKNGQRMLADKEENTLSLKPTHKDDTGSYRCAVRGYEHLPSPAQTLTVRSGQRILLYAIMGILVVIGCLALVMTSVVMRAQNRCCWSDGCVKQKNNVAAQTLASDTLHSNAESANQVEVQYATIVHQRPTCTSQAESSAEKASVSGTVLHAHQENDIQYVSVRFHHSQT